MERRLVELAQHGDQAAFTEIVAAVSPRLLGVARRILRDHHGAEDATQQALVLIWRKLPKLTHPDRFDAWAYRVLINACYAEARSDRGHAGGLELLEGDAVVEDDALSIVERDMLDRAFGRLPLEQRTVLVLQYYLDLGHHQIADLLGVPLGTVKSRAASGRQHLRAALEADARPPVRRWST